MRIGRKIFKFIIGTIIGLIVLVIAADIIFYFWLKGHPEKVEELIQANAGGNIEIGGIRGEFFFGFKIRDVIIFPSDDPTDQRLLRAANIDVDLSFISLLKLKPYPSKITVDDFDIIFTINEDGRFVLPAFTSNMAQGGEASGPLDLPGDVDLSLLRGSVGFQWHLKGGRLLNAGIQKVEGRGELSRKGRIQINNLVGHPAFASKEMHASGYIDPFESRSIELNITGDSVNLREVIDILKPLLKDAPSDMLPRGDANLMVAIQGPLKRLSIGGNVSLMTGRLANLQLSSAELGFDYEDGVFSLCNCTAKAYGGNINLNTEVRFDQSGLPYTFEMSFANVDVNSYLEQIGLYFAEATGDFHGNFKGVGELTNPRKLVAMGNFVSQGGTYRSPYLIPGSASAIERLSYQALRIDFEAAEGVISIVNLLLDSDELALVGRGTIASNRHLSLKGQMSTPKERALRIPSLKKWIGIIKTIDDRIVVDFTLEGDLARPKFSASAPGKILDLFYDAELDILKWYSGIQGGPFGENG